MVPVVPLKQNCWGLSHELSAEEQTLKSKLPVAASPFKALMMLTWTGTRKTNHIWESNSEIIKQYVARDQSFSVWEKKNWVSHEDNYWRRAAHQPEQEEVFLNPLTAYIHFKVWQILISEEILIVFTVVYSKWMCFFANIFEWIFPNTSLQTTINPPNSIPGNWTLVFTDEG